MFDTAAELSPQSCCTWKWGGEMMSVIYFLKREVANIWVYDCLSGRNLFNKSLKCWREACSLIALRRVLPGEVGGVMSRFSRLVKRGRGRMGGGLTVAEALPITKIEGFLEGNHRYGRQGGVLQHTDTQRVGFNPLFFFFFFLCKLNLRFLPRYLQQEPLVLHVLSPRHHIQFGDHGMVCREGGDVGAGSPWCTRGRF